jgi:phosphotransferase system  glucose/maltose/N-acetylglucosamine-specific IIC component
MPGTIRLAVSLMLVIAVVQLAGMSLGFMAADEMRQEVVTAYSADETFSGDDADAVVKGSLIWGVVLTGLLSAVWIWMAVKFRSGRRWARVSGTVLFGLFTCLLAPVPAAVER